MLVLTRRLQEEILVGNNIRIALLDIRGGKVRIGISAPADVPVLRSELRESDACPSQDDSRPVREAAVA